MNCAHCISTDTDLGWGTTTRGLNSINETKYSLFKYPDCWFFRWKCMSADGWAPVFSSLSPIVSQADSFFSVGSPSDACFQISSFAYPSHLVQPQARWLLLYVLSMGVGSMFYRFQNSDARPDIYDLAWYLDIKGLELIVHLGIAVECSIMPYASNWIDPFIRIDFPWSSSISRLPRRRPRHWGIIIPWKINPILSGGHHRLMGPTESDPS